MSERLQVEYLLTCAPGEDPAVKARDIALEQTAELPDDCLDDALRERITGRVDRLDALPERRYHCTIRFDAAELVGGELTQLLNLLFGNISLKDGILLTDIRWPRHLLRELGGPGQGTAGLRAATGVPEGAALLATALKPVGLDTAGLAARAGAFARGGIDLVKDDHGIADQPSAPFTERLAACQAAVEAANRETGGRTLYLPNVTAPAGRLEARLAAARDAGCQAVLLCPWLTGLEALSRVRDDYGLMVMAHPALTGSYFRRRHGIVPELLLGDLFRLAGADASIYPNTGGRFGFSLSTCEAINHRLRYPLEGIRPAMPTVGGGVDAADAAIWLERYGTDTILLLGASLYRQGDPRAAAQRLRTAIGRPLEAD